MRIAEIYRRTGLLTPRSLLGHGIWLDDADRSALAAGSIIAHCPTANAFPQSGAMDRTAHHAAGLRTALGSDIAGGPDHSMPRVARAMIQTAKSLGHPPPSAANAALALPQTARLAPGCQAGLLILRPDLPWQTAPDPLGMLLYGWDDWW